MRKTVRDYGKNSPVNPRTGYPAIGIDAEKVNADFYKRPSNIFGFGSEYCMDSEWVFFAPKVLGKKNISRLEKLYFETNKKYENEEKLFKLKINYDRYTLPDPRDWTFRTCNKDQNKWIQKNLTKEEISIWKMVRSYENRKILLYTCLKIAIENEFNKKYGYDLNKKNENNDKACEQKFITYIINNRKYKFHSRLETDKFGWCIYFEQINFDIIEEQINKQKKVNPWQIIQKFMNPLIRAQKKLLNFLANI